MDGQLTSSVWYESSILLSSLEQTCDTGHFDVELQPTFQALQQYAITSVLPNIASGILHKPMRPALRQHQTSQPSTCMLAGASRRRAGDTRFERNARLPEFSETRHCSTCCPLEAPSPGRYSLARCSRHSSTELCHTVRLPGCGPNCTVKGLAHSCRDRGRGH